VSAEAGVFTIDFNSIDLPMQGTTYAIGDATFSRLNEGYNVVTWDPRGEFRSESDFSNYLLLEELGVDAFIDFATGVTYVGMYWGSPNTGNSISFFDVENNLLGSYTPPSSLETSEFYNFTIDSGDTPISRVILTSESAAMAVDNISYIAVPEPSSCILIGSAVFSILILRRRSATA
jgi:hypothetical protein